MSFLLLIAGFCVLCLSGCVAILIISQRLLKRAFDMIDFVVAYVDFIVAYSEHHEHDCGSDRPEVSD